MRRIFLILSLLTAYLSSTAQVSRLGKDIGYKATLQGTVGNGDAAPFWFTNNRYGLGTLENNSGLLRVGIERKVETDSLRKWRIGYGADLVGTINHDSPFVLQQLYADFQYKVLRLSVGQKERPMELKNQNLTSGAMTNGINARPLPMIRLELPDFWIIPRTKNWLALKAHIAYGMHTDNRWQRDFTAGTNNRRSANSFYHSKAGFMRLGNVEKFPFTLTGGVEMACEFGGEVWNLNDRPDHSTPTTFDTHQKLPNGIKSFWNAFIPGGSDVNDGDYLNTEGNHLGSWHMRLDYHGKGWQAAVYAEHFFDDQSQMFWQYPWKDMLYGGEIHFPKNPVVSTFLYEHQRTNDQSGSLYHDGNAIMEAHICGIDDYYNHHVYGAWQHAGYTMGTPLLLSPVYNTNGMILCYDNRIKASHFGMDGNPTDEIAYRVLYTYEKSWGRYTTPHTDPKKGHFLFIEASYAPHQVRGLSVSASYGQNFGDLIGTSKGAMLSISYSGCFSRSKASVK